MELTKNINNIIPIPQSVYEPVIKSYLIRGLNTVESEGEKKKIMNRIQEQFENPENYFAIDQKLIIGKKLFNTRAHNRNLDTNLESHPNRKNNLRTNTIKLTQMTPSQSASIVNSNSNRHRTIRLPTGIIKDKLRLILGLTEPQSNTEMSSQNQIINIFEEAKRRCSKSKNEPIVIENNMLRSLDKRNFQKQENILKHVDRINLRSANISKKISSQVNKKEDELLMNRAMEFRMKKQIKEVLGAQKPFPEQFGEKAWMLDLRRDKKDKKLRINWINIATVENPVWKQLIEYPQKKMEIIQSPKIDAKKDLKHFLKNNYLKDVCKNANIDLERMNQLNQIEINGINLLDEELKKVSGSQGIKRVSNIISEKVLVKDEILKEFYYKADQNKITKSLLKSPIEMKKEKIK